MKRVFFSLLAVCMLNINVCAQTKSKSNLGSSQVVRIYKDAYWSISVCGKKSHRILSLIRSVVEKTKTNSRRARH